MTTAYRYRPDSTATRWRRWITTSSAALVLACNGTLTPIGELIGDATAPGDPGESGRVYGPCDTPVPDHVDLTQAIWGESGVHFYVPSATWALAATQASHQLEHLAAQSLDLRLSPSFWFAIGLLESFLGCDETVPPDPLHPQHAWDPQPASYADGCFQIDATTAWTEMCNLYPYPTQLDCALVTHADVISSTHQNTLGRSNVESSAVVVAYYAVFAYALLTTHGVGDPDAWFAAATDPLAREKVIALAYQQGAWFTELATVLQNCQAQAIESCLATGSAARTYVESVGSLIADLHAAVGQGRCYNPEVRQSDVTEYLDRLAPLFPHEDWHALRAQAHDAFARASGGREPAPFQQVASPVLDVLHDGLQARVACPDARLQALYSLSCPP